MLPLQHLTPEWQKTIREIAMLASKLDYGQIKIDVQNKRPVITEYTIKRKPSDESGIEVTGLF